VHDIRPKSLYKNHSDRSGKLESQQRREYLDFELQAWRPDCDRIEVLVTNSPADTMTNPVSVLQPQTNDVTLRLGSDVTLEGAVRAGRAMSRILLPEPVYSLLKRSLRIASRQRSMGVRLKLLLDAFLADLSWEFLYRPDMGSGNALSGFLVLDPSISLVRASAKTETISGSVAGRQRLLFVGTFWPGGEDRWQVEEEYKLLRSSLHGIRDLVKTQFVKASDPHAIEESLAQPAPIFHYSGHTDIDQSTGLGYLLEEADAAGPKLFSNHLAPLLARAGTRLAVFSACNSASSAFVRPLIDFGVPVIVGAGGIIYSDAALAFCSKLYESLAVGLSIDEAVTFARLNVAQLKAAAGKCDWARFTVYMNTQEAVLFPRGESKALRAQSIQRESRTKTIGEVHQLVKQLDGTDYGELMSELVERGVLILGRFTARRRKILEAIQQSLQQRDGRYIPVLFTFNKPKGRDLIESVMGFAALSRFVIADLTEPKSIPAELQQIVPSYPSLPIVPIISATAREFATFGNIKRRNNVVQPTVVYHDQDDLLAILDRKVIAPAEAKLVELQRDT
jgi:CHAT domain